MPMAFILKAGTTITAINQMKMKKQSFYSEKLWNLDPAYALAYTGLADAFAQKAGIFGSDEAWYDSSIKMSKKAIELNPNLAEAYKSLGVVYAYRGKFHSAIDYYSKALELNPNFGPAINNIGSMYWWLGRYDEAYPWAVKSIQVILHALPDMQPWD